MSEEGLAQKGHGSDQVQFMNAILVPVIVDEKGQGSLRRICDAGTNPVALKTCVRGPRRHGCQRAVSLVRSCFEFSHPGTVCVRQESG